MVFFGVQGLEAYIIIGWSASYLRDAGLTAAAAGLLLGLNQVIGIPLSALVPALTVRPRAAAAAAARVHGLLRGRVGRALGGAAHGPLAVDDRARRSPWRASR